MIELLTLGATVIHLGNRKVLPSAARAFATLLFLIEERDREVRRTELEAVLFPGENEQATNHKLRQLLYRLRRLGAPVEARGDSLSVPPSAVSTDYARLGEDEVVPVEAVRAVMGGVLPGYTPSFSRPFAHWVEERRTAIQHDVLQQFVRRLTVLRGEGRWRELDPLAHAVLALDPLNEEATLALAEALALSGQKASAVQLLDTYLGEVAPYGRDIRVPAHVLRTRISERVRARSYRRVGPGPFVGRESEFAEMWSHYQVSKRGDGRVAVIHGEAGIGKTRLATECLQAAALDGATCLSVECAPHDVRRPLGVFVDLVPKLLAAPGGLGVDPSALEHLHRLTKTPSARSDVDDERDPRQVFELIVEAIRDLVDAVSGEHPLVVLVDDAHFIDPASLRAIVEFTGKGARLPVLFLLTSRTKLQAGDATFSDDCVFWQRVRPLDAVAAESLFAALVEGRKGAASGSDAESLIAMAAGNPLYLRWLITEPSGVSTSGLPPSLDGLLRQRIQRLSDTTLRAFVAAVLLGKHCRLDRLVRVAGMTQRVLLAAIQDLELQGYLVANGTDIRSSHPMLSQVAMAELPPLTAKLMRSSVAELLEAEATPAHDVALLWDAAEHWHEVGSTDRAVGLLQSCARHCLTIGQPAVACELLKRALAISSDGRRTDLLSQLINAARSAEDFPLLLRTIEGYRETTRVEVAGTPHDDLEMLALQARRYSGTPLPDLIPHLRVCVLAPDASPSHRLSVAPQLMAAYDLLLDGDSAHVAHAAISSIPRSTEQDEINGYRSAVQYHVFAGTLAQAKEAGFALLDLVSAVPSDSLRTRLTADLGIALFRCGDVTDGLKAMHRACSMAHDRGMLPSTIDTLSMLAWMYYVIGDVNNWRTYDTLSNEAHDRAPSGTGRLAHYLSNKIEFALAAGNEAVATSWLSRARKDYSEINTPRSRLVAHAFDLRARQLANAERHAADAPEVLAAEHETGKQWGLHDNFVEAYWHELSHHGQHGAANAMLAEYIIRHRRDGFPLLPPLNRIAREEGIASDERLGPATPLG